MANSINPVSVTALRSLPIFAALEDEQLRVIAAVARLRHVERRTSIVRVGEQLDSIYLILAGRAKAQVCNANGREVILYLLGQGDLIGEMAAIDDQPGTVNVTSVDP